MTASAKSFQTENEVTIRWDGISRSDREVLLGLAGFSREQIRVLRRIAWTVLTPSERVMISRVNWHAAIFHREPVAVSQADGEA